MNSLSSQVELVMASLYLLYLVYRVFSDFDHNKEALRHRYK